jgi:hypothetical protein
MNSKHFTIDDFEFFLLTVLVHVGVETFAQSAGTALVPAQKRVVALQKLLGLKNKAEPKFIVIL